jgi:LPXTG-site transpeptidase (sortase) family protein
VAFSDTYPFDLINVATVLNTCGGTLTATAGANNISLTGGSIPVSSSCAVSVTVKATHAGTLVNTTSAVTSTEGGTGNTATDTLTVTGTGLSLVKSTTTVGYQTAGDAISYSYLLTNTGSPDLYPPYTVSDNKASGVICPSTPDPLPQNGTVTCTATYNVVEPPDITNGSVTNTATGTAHDASGGGGNIVTSNPSSVTVHIESLALKKSTTTTSYKNVGDTINYNYTLTNTGGVTLYAPFDVGDNKIGGGTFSCGAITSLAPGANVTCTATYTVIAGDVSAGSVTNTATGTAYDSGGKIVLSNSSSVTVYTLIPPTISKAFSPTSIKVGETSILTFTITNPAANAVPLTGVTFTDNLPAGLSVASAPSAAQCGGTVNSTATSVTLTAGTIINGIGGLDGLCTVTVIVSGNTSGVKNNTSGAVSSTNSGTGNTANATLTVTGPPTISKSFTPGSILQGGTSTITFTLTNPAGNTVPLTGVGFTDSLPLGVTVATSGPISACGGSQTTTSPSTISFSGGILAIGGTCTLTVNVTAGSAGTFNNTTSAVTSTEGGTGATSNTATLIANATVDLAITKNDGRTLVSHGDVLTYSIVVSNTGPNPATGATVTDVIPATLTGATWTCTPAPPATCTASGSGNINDTVTIPVNGSVTYTLTATVTNVIANDVINIATVSPPAGLADTNLANNSATDIDHLTNNGVKTLTGTEQPGSTGTNVLIGEIIDYQIRIDIPNGTVDNLKAVDVLDHGLAFVGCDLTTPITKGTLVLGKNPCTTFGNPTVQAEPVTDLDPASENAGRHITFDFGNVTNPSGSTQSLYVNYRVIVLNIKDNASGVTGLNNAVEWSWTVTPPSGPPVTYTLTGAATGVDVIEPHLSITKSVNPAIAAPGSTVTFTIEISHASNSTAPAYDALMTDGIPTGLGLNQASIVVTPSAGLTAVPVIKTSATQFSVYWSEFPLGESATIIFTATYNGPSPLVNTANVEWSSIQIDPATHLVPLSTFNRHSTERRYDPLNQSLNDYIAAASATLRFPKGPLTGFAPGQITLLPPQPEDKAYQNLGSLWLEIPHISVKTSIVGIPLGTDGNWDLTWLSDQAGYLDGTAYPTHAGNSVLTGHVYLADGSPGPFINLHTLQYGDQIIVHLDDQNYIYEVRSDQVTSTSDTSAFKHEDYPWLTLITCKDYDAATNTYTHHVVVRAVLIKIDSDTLPNPGGSRH